MRTTAPSESYDLTPIARFGRAVVRQPTPTTVAGSPLDWRSPAPGAQSANAAGIAWGGHRLPWRRRWQDAPWSQLRRLGPTPCVRREDPLIQE